MDYNLLNGGDLAFIGDAYYELYIRKYVLDKGMTSLGKLHSECVKYVSRYSQNKIIKELYSLLSEEEQIIFKRGRNYNYKDKSDEYINASGFEAVIGYLYLNNKLEKLNFYLQEAIKIIEEK